MKSFFSSSLLMHPGGKGNRYVVRDAIKAGRLARLFAKIQDGRPKCKSDLLKQVLAVAP